MIGNKIVGFHHHPTNEKLDITHTFSVKRVIGLTMAPDGVCYANLKGFRQVRIRYQDYMKLKEAGNATETRQQ